MHYFPPQAARVALTYGDPSVVDRSIPRRQFFTAPCGCGLQHRGPWGRSQLYVWRKVGLTQADAQNTTVDAHAPDPRRKCGPCSGVAKPEGRRMPKHRCAPLGGMVLQDLDEI